MHYTLIASTAALSALVPRQMRNCPAIPTCPRWNGCVSTSTNGAVFQLTCATDYNGPIIDSAQADVFVDCADACSRHKDCVAFNMKGSFCYLLGNPKGTARPATNVSTGNQLKGPTIAEPAPGSSTCTDVIDCPTDDKCRYTTANQKPFIAQCNWDYYGGDIAYKSTESMTKCVDVCSVTTGCVAVTWFDQNCYLKNNNTNMIYNNNVDSKPFVQLRV
ncbi:uncharacterized protein J4E92_009426 [Alternaria infectoria]|uniref:uncharacterized protein n=1 Tax=Alternaria infectoria TaxID=45303 RepID=UPI0022209106|nr:uncharacterized protein J4E92_009426 [Alternaria infectoria]KAI4915150.1 hypothetical protein J4E92_009426 [Alternaria infectoria]